MRYKGKVPFQSSVTVEELHLMEASNTQQCSSLQSSIKALKHKRWEGSLLVLPSLPMGSAGGSSPQLLSPAAARLQHSRREVRSCTSLPDIVSVSSPRVLHKPAAEPDSEMTKLPSLPVSIETSREDSSVTPSLPALLKELHRTAGKWCELGTQLGLEVGVLEQVRESSGENPDLCLMSMLDRWLKSKEPSWMAVVNALRSRQVSEQHLASLIFKQHLAIF